MRVPIQVPSVASQPHLEATAGAVGGLLFSDYLASMTAGALNLTTSTQMFAVKGIGKALLGTGFYMLSDNAQSNRIELISYLASVGSFASIGVDFIDLMAGTSAEKAGASLGQRVADSLKKK